MVEKFTILSSPVMTSLIMFHVLSVAIVAVSRVHGGLEESLKYWETLSMSNIKRRIVKRDTRSQQPVEQLINFDSHGRQFSLLLHIDFSVLSPGFKILVFDEDGASHRLHLDLNIYRGVVLGEKKSYISAYFNDDQVLSASIQTASEHYVVEPAVNLIPNATNDTMIIYKESDLRFDNTSRCGYVNDDGDELEPVTDQPLFNETQHSRTKRGTCTNTNKDTCSLYLAADPKFIQNVGLNDLRTSANILVSVIDAVDQMYRQHQFDDCDSGFGFEITKIHLFPKATEGFIYTQPGYTDYSKFLEAFNTDDSLFPVCLGHVFTYQGFADDGGYVLGLAYTGSPDAGKRGGICSISPVYRNSGWTSYKGKGDITALQARLVTAHELGHNWGSPHDSDSTPSCSPSSSHGGKFLMYPVSVGGDDSNNYLFSECSKAAMGEVLSTKATCLIEKKSAFCGNYEIDGDEQCDPGFHVASDHDTCCDSNCQLRSNAQCSDSNHACCRNCRVITAADGLLTCYRTSSDVCELDSICNGRDFVCPKPMPKPDGTQCFNRGKCLNGTCKSLCFSYGYTTCSCEKDVDACKRCCVDAQGSCFPLLVNGTYLYLTDGKPCIFGICNANGECIKSSRSPILRIWNLLNLSSPEGLARFLRNNFVATIIILSLIVWIPISCCVCYLDRKAARQRKALINEVVDEELNDGKPGSPASGSPSPGPPSPGPPSPGSPAPGSPAPSHPPRGQRASERRDRQKESIRRVVKHNQALHVPPQHG